jgi:hypothetical protein
VPEAVIKPGQPRTQQTGAARYSARQPVEENLAMKNIFLAALAALSLSAAIVPAANAAVLKNGNHSGPYDNTGNGPGQTGLEGGGN